MGRSFADMEEATGLRSLAVARQSLLRMDEADQAAGRQRRDATDVYFVICAICSEAHMKKSPVWWRSTDLHRKPR